MIKKMKIKIYLEFSVKITIFHIQSYGPINNNMYVILYEFFLKKSSLMRFISFDVTVKSISLGLLIRDTIQKNPLYIV